MTVSLEDLVARCIEALEAGEKSVVDRLCEAHPEHATAIRRQLAHLDSSGLLSAADTIEIPEQVGPYRVVRPLGRGGMGSVFLAEQAEPVRREVALKVIKLGMDSREVLARFELERQSLARMNHPHIATVYDAGLTDEGRPYFAMEYVPGEPITTYCVSRKLPTEARLRLLAQVCDAVQHAHHKGVIHRDLKPSNVLVMERDGVAVAKVIDFGVAKAMAQDENATLRTEQGQIVGTPEYMSPEQAGRADVDSRTDVYALGVLLYELLTGALPFDPVRLRTSVAELRRIVREEDPPTPSNRVSTRGVPSRDRNGASNSARESTRLDRQLGRRLRGDLDWITLKALAKDRDRRYPTPHDLAQDLRRHLNNEPVQAGPPSGWYRVQKFVRRYRVPVAAGGAVLLALVAGLIASLTFYSQARRSAHEANASYADALAAVDQLLTRVGDERLAEVPHTERVRRELLEDALQFYRRFLADRQGDDALRLQVASAHARVGRILLALGTFDGAEAEYESAIEQLSQLPVSDGQRFALAGARVGRADVRRRLDRDDGIEADLRAAAAEYARLREADVHDLRYPIGEAMAYSSLGAWLMRGDAEAARSAFERAVNLSAHVKAKTGSRDDRLRWSLYRVDLADCLDLCGELQRARTELSEARAEIEALSELHAGELDLRIALARVCQKLAMLNARYGQGGASLHENVDTALEIREALAREFPSVRAHRVAVATLLVLRAKSLFHTRRVDEANAAFRVAVGAWEELVERHPDVPDYRRRLAGTLHHFGGANLTLRQMGSARPTKEAEAVLRRCLDEYRRLLRDDPSVVAHRDGVAVTCAMLGELLFFDDRFEEVEAFAEEGLRVMRALVADLPDRHRYRRYLSDLLRLRGQVCSARGAHDEAERALRESLEQLEESLARGGPEIWRQAFTPIYQHLVETLLATEQHAGAAQCIREASELNPDYWVGREAAARSLLECRRLAQRSGADPDVLADYAHQAVDHARFAVDRQAQLHGEIGKMNKMFIARAKTMLLLAQAQFAVGARNAALQDVAQAIGHARAAWGDPATGFDDRRLRSFYSDAVELLRQHGAASDAERLVADVRQALGEDG